MKKVLSIVLLLFVTTGLYAQGNDTCVNEKEGMLLLPSVSSTLRSSVSDDFKDIMSDSYAGGSGTESDPYLIETKEQFARLCYEAADETKSWEKKLEGIHFKQTKDIDFKDMNLAVGNGCWFAGIYDGNNQAIRNYTFVKESVIERSDNKNYGRALFINMDGATIKNVRMENCYIDISVESDTIYCSVAGLATAPKNSKFINCTVDGTYSLKAEGTASIARIGGLLARSTNNEINNCQSIQNTYCELNSNEGESAFIYAAGIVAEATNTKIINCTSKGNVESYGYGKSEELVIRAAGMVALGNSCEILNCGNKSGLLSTKVKNEQKDGLAFAQTAGMISCMSGGIVENCWTIAPMKSEGYNAQVSGSAAIGYFWDNPVVRNCHYQQDDLKSLRSDTEDITGHTAEFMKSQAFIDLLNVHLPEGGLLWKKGTAGYPGIFAVHNVTLPLLTGAITTPANGTHEVEEGEHFRFALILDEEYNQSKPVVTTGTGEILKPDADQNYITDMVTEELTIHITGIVKNPATANEDITTGSKVYVVGDVLHILSDKPTLMEIFNVRGQRVKSTMTFGDIQMQLPQGLYIVRLDNQSYKVGINK